jgi:type 1 glutamine amidotransferase
MAASELMKRYLTGLLVVGALFASNGLAADKKIVFIAGNPSHGPGEHEHRAGCLLLQSCLQTVPGVTAVVYTNGWPAEADTAFADAAAIIIYCDGGGGHPFLKENRLQTIGGLMKKGVGLACLHYGVEPTKKKGQPEFLDWIGGAFEINWSVNPHWDADFKSLPKHPITRGVAPFKLRDEWYFNLRFREGLKGVTPILSAVPDGSTTNRNDGPHEGNPAVRAMVARGDGQTVAWACERADGGRGFGFTGGHFHRNWGDDNFRKVMLNAILWVAKVEVPADGVPSKVTPEQLQQNLDPKGKRN